jgi:hypothetical protein
VVFVNSLLRRPSTHHVRRDRSPVRYGTGTDPVSTRRFLVATGLATDMSDEARRTETMGDLDPETWQTLNCPRCGDRLATVFIVVE